MEGQRAGCDRFEPHLWVKTKCKNCGQPTTSHPSGATENTSPAEPALASEASPRDSTSDGENSSQPTSRLRTRTAAPASNVSVTKPAATTSSSSKSGFITAKSAVSPSSASPSISSSASVRSPGPPRPPRFIPASSTTIPSTSPPVAHKTGLRQHQRRDSSPASIQRASITKEKDPSSATAPSPAVVAAVAAAAAAAATKTPPYNEKEEELKGSRLGGFLGRNKKKKQAATLGKKESIALSAASTSASSSDSSSPLSSSLLSEDKKNSGKNKKDKKPVQHTHSAGSLPSSESNSAKETPSNNNSEHPAASASEDKDEIIKKLREEVQQLQMTNQQLLLALSKQTSENVKHLMEKLTEVEEQLTAEKEENEKLRTELSNYKQLNDSSLQKSAATLSVPLSKSLPAGALPPLDHSKMDSSSNLPRPPTMLFGAPPVPPSADDSSALLSSSPTTTHQKGASRRSAGYSSKPTNEEESSSTSSTSRQPLRRAISRGVLTNRCHPASAPTSAASSPTLSKAASFSSARPASLTTSTSPSASASSSPCESPRNSSPPPSDASADPPVSSEDNTNDTALNRVGLVMSGQGRGKGLLSSPHFQSLLQKSKQRMQHPEYRRSQSLKGGDIRLMAEHEKRSLVVKEIITTERTYLQGLRTVIDDYQRPMEAKLTTDKRWQKFLTTENIKTIFYQLTIIVGFNQLFLEKLEQRLDSPEWSIDSKLADVFITMGDVFRVYAGYINNYSQAINTLVAVKKNRKFQEFLENVEATHTKQGLFAGHNLEMFLITPIQRIPRYVILLKSLLKYTPKDHPDHPYIQEAIEKMDQVAMQNQRSQAAAENINILFKLQKRFLQQVQCFVLLSYVIAFLCGLLC
ncbi:DH domain-containing protein (Fragment), variant 2 [Balamuthia mandrillaris]